MSVMLRSTYRALGVLGHPLLKQYLNKRARRGKEDASRLAERFGHASMPRPSGTLIWIHAASVGELQSVLALITRISDAYPQAHMLITTGTVTSAQLLAARNLPRVIHQFVPMDSYFSVKRFLHHWQPDLALWVESEFWPELLHQTQLRGTPTMLINARMSEKSAARWARLQRVITPLVNGFSAVFPSTEKDAERLKRLGSPRIMTTGNLKFDAPPLPADTASLSAFSASTDGRPMILAASTHDGEETIIAHATTELRATYPDLLTVIVPRHATRGDGIVAMLNQHTPHVVQRSKAGVITSATQYYVADTMGELGLFFRACDIVCMGGSFTPHGGHNLLEPARLNCAIITGQHMHNFAEMAARMQQAGAILIAADAQALQAACKLLLGNPEKQLNLADKAWQFVQESQGAADAIMTTIAQQLRQKA